MKIIVQKFGGTSLETEAIRTKVISHISRAKENDYQVVVVVSALGRKGHPYATDTLLDWIKSNGNSLPLREQDLLLSCGEIISGTTLCSLLQANGIEATVLTGMQAGIITDDNYGAAQVKEIRLERITKELSQGKVVIVCGFQGSNEQGEVTTLGRGGSDTTAAVLGVALEAEYVDIFTDVDGIMTADPRIVPDAIPLNHITYQELSHLAYQGAKVVHPRAVEIAMKAKLTLRVRRTASHNMGTLVTSLNENEPSHEVGERLITGIAHVSGLSQIKASADKNDFSLHLNVFKAMAENMISVDFISVNPFQVVYTVSSHHEAKAAALVQQLGYQVEVEPGCAKVAAVGAGMVGQPGVMAQVVEALTRKEIQILQSADSHTTIWVLIKEEHVHQAVNALHQQFKLNVKSS